MDNQPIGRSGLPVLTSHELLPHRDEKLQQLCGGDMSSYRSLMETCKFTSPQDTLQAIATTAQLWTKVAVSDELWNSFLDQLEFPGDSEELISLSSKERYRHLTCDLSGYLVVIKGAKLSLFNARKNQVTKTMSIKVDKKAGAALLSTSKVFVCGGENSQQRAFIASFETGEVLELAPMIDPRRFHGTVEVNGSIYVFGGDNTPSTAEKYSISSQFWSRLPDMHSMRSAFTPCVKQPFIYLCGGNTVKCEVFNTQTEEYIDLPLTLHTSTWCVTSLYQDELILEFRSGRLKWNVNTQVSNFERRTGLITLY